jgi:hypothetical protein
MRNGFFVETKQAETLFCFQLISLPAFYEVH